MHHETLMTKLMEAHGLSSEAEFLCRALGLGPDMYNQEVVASVSWLREETLARFERDADALVVPSLKGSNESVWMVKNQLASAWTMVALNKWSRGEGTAAFFILWSLIAVQACQVLQRACANGGDSGNDGTAPF